MKFWFDTEFIEDGHTIDLISIGVVSEDGREYYAESGECALGLASPWVRENVIPHLTMEWKSRSEIKQDLLVFFGESPEIWAYFASYDWIALCQLFGTMMQLPDGWPMFPMDLQMLRALVGMPDLIPHTGTAHNALDDARWTRDAWIDLDKLIRTRNQNGT